jgi:hypothetical protein
MLCAATLLIAIALFMYTPGSGPEWTVITGVISMLALGELVIRIAEREAAGNRIVSKASESVEAT